LEEESGESAIMGRLMGLKAAPVAVEVRTDPPASFAVDAFESAVWMEPLAALKAEAVEEAC